MVCRRDVQIGRDWQASRPGDGQAGRQTRSSGADKKKKVGWQETKRNHGGVFSRMSQQDKC